MLLVGLGSLRDLASETVTTSHTTGAYLESGSTSKHLVSDASLVPTGLRP
jgi:hypothetical protein